MSEETKVCKTCKIEKPVTEFYVSTKKGIFGSCKSCRCALNVQYQRKIRKCAKVFCPVVKESDVIHLSCKVCGVEYGMPVVKYNSKMKSGNPKDYPKYCSVKCHNIGMSKQWQQTHSPYAKKIKELQKVYK